MKVSVITVCRNAAEDLKRTLQSVAEQAGADMEYLVVDGLSNDGTADLLHEYEPVFAAAGIPFRYVSERDSGTYDAMNKGADMAQGDWIIYMNAGDAFYAPDTLRTFWEHPVASDIGYCYGDTYKVWDFGGGIETPEEGMKDNPYMPFCHQSVFVRAELMRTYRFDTAYRIVADFDLFYRMQQAGVNSCYIPQVVSRYNGQYGLSAQNPLQIHKEGLLIRGIKGTWQYPIRLAWVYLRYGWVSRAKALLPEACVKAWMKYKRRRFVR